MVHRILQGKSGQFVSAEPLSFLRLRLNVGLWTFASGTLDYAACLSLRKPRPIDGEDCVQRTVVSLDRRTNYSTLAANAAGEAYERLRL